MYPQPGALAWATLLLPTVRGQIGLRFNQTAAAFDATVTVPPGSTARVRKGFDITLESYLTCPPPACHPHAWRAARSHWHLFLFLKNPFYLCARGADWRL